MAVVRRTNDSDGGSCFFNNWDLVNCSALISFVTCSAFFSFSFGLFFSRSPTDSLICAMFSSSVTLMYHAIFSLLRQITDCKSLAGITSLVLALLFRSSVPGILGFEQISPRALNPCASFFLTAILSGLDWKCRTGESSPLFLKRMFETLSEKLIWVRC